MEQKVNGSVMVQNNNLNQNSGRNVMRLFHGFENKQNMAMVGLTIFVVIAGITTGWIFSGTSASTSSQTESQQSAKQESKMTQSETEAGIADESKFGSTAEGMLVEGGIDGEGTHHLERAGGATQNVYLTSTVIDLQSFVGKKVTVWGDTISGMDAGWLMDVGKIKVTE